jgi:hypothetical protein
MKEPTYEMSVQEIEDMYDMAATKAQLRFDELGLTQAPRPMDDDGTFYDGRLPSNVNSLSNSELAEVHARHIAFMAWLEEYMTEARCRQSNLKEKLKKLESKVRLSHSGTVAARDDKTAVDARCKETREALQEEEEYLTKVDASYNQAVKAQKLISRLITQKGIEVDMNRRDINIGRGRNGRGPWSRSD